jgi:hypothetical protein
VYVEPCPGQQLGDVVGLQPVGVAGDVVAVGLGHAPALVADVEAEQQLPTGREHPEELREDVGELLRRGVDDRVPGQDAAEGITGKSRPVIEPTSKRSCG